MLLAASNSLQWVAPALLVGILIVGRVVAFGAMSKIRANERSEEQE